MVHTVAAVGRIAVAFARVAVGVVRIVVAFVRIAVALEIHNNCFDFYPGTFDYGYPKMKYHQLQYEYNDFKTNMIERIYSFLVTIHLIRFRWLKV